MSVDIRQLAVDRVQPAGESRRAVVGPPRRVLSRIVLPALLMTGFVLVSAWAARDLLLPRHDVTVMPVHVSTPRCRSPGTPLFKAAGWIEPRPTPIRVAALAEGVIEKLLVVEDQAVKAGEPIAFLVADDAQLALEAAQATLDARGRSRAQSRPRCRRHRRTLRSRLTCRPKPRPAEADLKESNSTRLRCHLRSTVQRRTCDLPRLTLRRNAKPPSLSRRSNWSKPNRRSTQRGHMSKN